MNYPYPHETDPQQAQPFQDIKLNAGSADDCTGLIPTISGEDDDQLESYAQLYGFLPPEPREKQ